MRRWVNMTRRGQIEPRACHTHIRNFGRGMALSGLCGRNGWRVAG